ncbi:hypothetical protein [Phormidesmis sp. 146-33]
MPAKSARARMQRSPLGSPIPTEAKPVVRLEPILNLDRINLEDRGNWLRALEVCRPQAAQSLDELLGQIASYQGQIDRAIQTAQAQSTIYAYAIGTRLNFIDQHQLYEKLGYRNLTDFINGGEIKRSNGDSITARQVWSYRRVTKGLDEFLELVEELRNGSEISEEIQIQVKQMGERLQHDVVESFLASYVDGIAGVLELGVSKLEQVCRLPRPIAFSGLLAGQLPLSSEAYLPVYETSFSQLRKAISQYEKPPEVGSLESTVDKKLAQIERLVKEVSGLNLEQSQKERLQTIHATLQVLL